MCVSILNSLFLYACMSEYVSIYIYLYLCMQVAMTDSDHPKKPHLQLVDGSSLLVPRPSPIDSISLPTDANLTSVCLAHSNFLNANTGVPHAPGGVDVSTSSAPLARDSGALSSRSCDGDIFTSNESLFSSVRAELKSLVDALRRADPEVMIPAAISFMHCVCMRLCCGISRNSVP